MVFFTFEGGDFPGFFPRWSTTGHTNSVLPSHCDLLSEPLITFAGRPESSKTLFNLGKGCNAIHCISLNAVENVVGIARLRVFYFMVAFHVAAGESKIGTTDVCTCVGSRRPPGCALEMIATEVEHATQRTASWRDTCPRSARVITVVTWDVACTSGKL